MSKIESFEIEISQLKRDRTVWVYLPDDYKQVGEPFPVIYMHDGQNLFYDKLTAYGEAWHIDKVMDKIYASTGRSAIIIGVECYDRRRLSEYSPWKINPLAFDAKKNVAKDKGNRGGEGKLYAEFFTKNLKNAVDSRYNTDKERNATAIIGSSMGGLISCYIGLNHQRLYETMGLFSTYTQFNRKAFNKFLAATPQTLEQYALVYCGGMELDSVSASKRMLKDSWDLYERLSNRGIHCELLFNSDNKHYESAWGVYFDKFARDFLERYYSSKK
ncbi:MAG: alpha/beta hydrolase-fold protein [Clostridia bacterium]|nr:alpha/beta hydrolase-fold protein [Clostridia bacterium]